MLKWVMSLVVLVFSIAASASHRITCQSKSDQFIVLDLEANQGAIYLRSMDPDPQLLEVIEFRLLRKSPGLNMTGVKTEYHFQWKDSLVQVNIGDMSYGVNGMIRQTNGDIEMLWDCVETETSL